MWHRKILYVTMAAIFGALISLSIPQAAFAAGEKKSCQQGLKWDKKLQKCVEDPNAY